jgi:hypothetical protein
MPLTRPTFTVYVNGTEAEPSEHAVTITHQDQLKAETQLAAAGVNPTSRALMLTTAWVWAALVRTDQYTATFKRFHDTDCAGIETEDAEGEPVDPTQGEADTGSPSPSDSTGPASTGSQPMKP